MPEEIKAETPKATKKSAPKASATVVMNNGEIEANVHPDMVEEYAKGNFVKGKLPK